MRRRLSWSARARAAPRALLRSFIVLPVLTAALAQPALAQPAQGASGDALFATVGTQKITLGEYRIAFNQALRKKYYHARPPEEALPAFQREVGEDLVNRTLLVGEAKRRGHVADRKRIDAALADYESRYKSSSNWAQNRDRMLGAIVRQMETDLLLAALEGEVRKVRAPAESDLRAFYGANKSLFVEPEQVRLSVILLKVDPGSPQSAWNAARDEAARLHAQLLRSKGADFAALARARSQDASAAQGGDMGYVHRGMLPAPVHATVDGLKPAQFAAPVQLLEGYAILRLEDRKAARQRAFEEVRERCADLWRRAEADAAWKTLIAELRRRTVVKIDESQYLPLTTVPLTTVPLTTTPAARPAPPSARPG